MRVAGSVDPLDPHHDGSALFTQAPDGGARVGDVVRLRVLVPTGAAEPAQVVLRSVRDGEPHVQSAVPAGCDPRGAWWEVDLELVNPLTRYRFLLVDHAGGYRWLTAAGVVEHDVADLGDFALSTEHRLPGWVADQVGYQVFPDRFARTTPGPDDPASLPDWAQPAAWDDPVLGTGPDVPYQLFGGTLDGVAEHLDHLADLGAGLLYLTPFFPARSNHRYDAASFDEVDPLLGGDAALERLIDAAHRRGIRVVGDLTTNHTGDSHPWFETARREPDSAERAFYHFSQDPDGGERYASWLGVPSLPVLDHTSPEMARRLYAGPGSVVARWLAAGLDGWRIDVANMTGRHGTVDVAHDVARTVRGTFDEVAPEAWLLAEHGHDATSDLQGPGWHGTMDYAGFTRPVWAWLNGGSAAGPGEPHGLTWLGLPVPVPVLPARACVATMRTVHAAAPWSSWTGSTLHLDSHDVPRFRSVVGAGVHGGIDGTGRADTEQSGGAHRDPLARHVVGIGLQMTMPGVPVVFAGDELGLTGGNGEHSRTPMPWAHRETWDAPTLEAYRAWIALRHDHVALRRGGLRWLAAGDDHLAYLREHADETLLVLARRTAGEPTSLPALGFSAAEALLGPATARLEGGRWALSGEGPAVSVWRLA